MSKPKFLTAKFIENAVRFLLYFAAVALTPFLGKATAGIWNKIAYGYLYGLFTEIHTVLFWLLEAVLFYLVGKLLREKGVLTVEAPKKESWKPIPPKNLCILTGICAGCVLLLSAVIGFQVKPFYDLGEKVTGYQIWCAVGVIGRNAFKCMWALAMLLCGLRMADELIKAYAVQEKPWLRLLLGGSFLLLFGIFDIFTSVLAYPVNTRSILIAAVYFLFYALFPLVYYYAEENRGKTCLMMVFIYLF